MNEDRLEKLSAMMDGELIGRDRDIVIDQIESDPETRACWQRYHMIGDTLRSTMPGTVSPDLAVRLNQMLANEPTILAPKSGLQSYKNFIKPLAGMAIAASITAVAVLGIQQQNQELPGTENFSQIAISEAGMATPLIADNAKADAVTVRTVKYQAGESNQDAEELTPYILNHNQHNSRLGVQGVSPYARLVGHDAN